MSEQNYNCASDWLCQPKSEANSALSAELTRVFWSASYVLGAQKVRQGERKLAGRVVVQIMMRQEMPSAADVAAIDEACDRVLAGMRSQLATFVQVERAVRRARGEGRA